MPKVATRSLRARAVCALALLGLAQGSARAASTSQELDLVLERTPDPARGAKLYETCAACHGPRGEGVSDGSVPAIGGQPFTVVAKQLVDFRIGGRFDPRMQHFSDTAHLAYSQDVADVAIYISRLPPRQVPLQSSSPAADRGAVLYVRRCKRCHGSRGEGKADQFVPRLAGQHAAYIIRELTELPSEARPTIKQAHGDIATYLSHQEIAALAACLSQL